MKIENLDPVVRAIVRYVALGCSDEDIAVEFPQFEARQIAKIRAGATFKRALREMQEEIDAELVAKQGEDPVRAFLRSKGLASARTLAELAENADGETPHAVQAKAADSILAKGGYATAQEQQANVVLMLSPAKLAAVQEGRRHVDDVPDYVDGHTQEIPGVE